MPRSHWCEWEWKCDGDGDGDAPSLHASHYFLPSQFKSKCLSWCFPNYFGMMLEHSTRAAVVDGLATWEVHVPLYCSRRKMAAPSVNCYQYMLSREWGSICQQTKRWQQQWEDEELPVSALLHTLILNSKLFSYLFHATIIPFKKFFETKMSFEVKWRTIIQ